MAGYAELVAPDSWWATHRMMEAIDWIHTTGGLEWWGTITALTIATRVVIFPVTLFSMRNAAMVTKLKPKTDEMMEQQQQCDMNTDSGRARALALRTKIFKLYSDNNCNPLYSLVPILAQLPVLIFGYSALLAMSSHKTGSPWHGFETGGLLWFPDLSVPDPMYGLPIVASASFFLTTYLQDPANVASKQQAEMMRYAGMGLSVFFLPIMANMSSAVVLYFSATNLIGVGQTALLRSAAFRRLVGLPPTVDAAAAASEQKREKPPEPKPVVTLPRGPVAQAQGPRSHGGGRRQSKPSKAQRSRAQR